MAEAQNADPHRGLLLLMFITALMQLENSLADLLVNAIEL